ncbi:beta-ketoacyl synthase chain length factor [Hydrogenophaga aquatica]
MNTPLQAWIEGIGLIAPGLPSWDTARAVLQGEGAWEMTPSALPAPDLLPAAERRRASRVVKLALALGVQAAGQRDLTTLATVFSSSGADGHNCHALCEQLAGEDRHISPTRFHNSVHNAAAGYWGIASRSMEPCQVLCAYDASFGAGLLDALAQVATTQRPVLLVAYDSEYPEPLHAARPVPDCAGVALLLTPQATDGAQAHIALAVSSQTPQPLRHAALEPLRQAIPALRCLPMLEQLASGQAGTVHIAHLPGMPLAIKVTPC